MQIERFLCAAALVAVTVGGCKDDSSDPGGFRHGAFYQQLQDCAAGFVFAGGEWLEDFDDAAFYGPAFYARAGETADNAAYRQLAQESAARNHAILREADLVTGDVNLIAMAALGLIEYIGATGDRTALEDLDAVIGDIETLVAAMSHYVPPAVVPGYAMETYGPVSINGLMALIGLQRAAVIGEEGAGDVVSFAEDVVAQLKKRHFDGSVYSFGTDREGMFLYPNITMIIVNARLHQLTGKPEYREHALAIHQGIQPLRVTAGDGLAGVGRYRSPYSGEHMGATSDDYTTLSSQNYAAQALMLLHQISGEQRFLQEVDAIFGFIREKLQGQSCAADMHLHQCDPGCGDEQACLKERCFDDACHCGVLHHWMDDRLAVPSDPEFFCSGCNLQLLYVMWYRQHGLAPAE